jgi:hypothetical protein
MAKGRRKGSRNRGYYFRAGRGWLAKINGRYVALEHENGDRMLDRETLVADIKAAHVRLIAAPVEAVQAVESVESVTVEEVCLAYLEKVKADGAKSTYIVRQNTIFDFCCGLPSRFVPNGKPKPEPKRSDHIHKGYGKMPVDALRPIDIDHWIQCHPGWKGCRRTKIQAIKRAFNYGVEAKLIARNPIKGYKTPKQRPRTTYLTPEQEAALIGAANPALATAIKVCIRTGARPGCEFAKLTAKHVRDNGNRMEWVFRPEESKTKILRIIRITDPELLAIIREQIKLHPTGAVFRNTEDTAWTRELLTEKFRKAKLRMIEQGTVFDDDACMYSCRHTYAKRVLQGFWSGKPTNIETLARLMGNSPQICHEHYLQWCDSYTEPLWESA